MFANVTGRSDWQHIPITAELPFCSQDSTGGSEATAQCPHSAPPSAPRAQLPICFTCAKQGSSTLTFYGCFEGTAPWGKPRGSVGTFSPEFYQTGWGFCFLWWLFFFLCCIKTVLGGIKLFPCGPKSNASSRDKTKFPSLALLSCEPFRSARLLWAKIRPKSAITHPLVAAPVAVWALGLLPQQDSSSGWRLYLPADSLPLPANCLPRVVWRMLTAAAALLPVPLPSEPDIFVWASLRAARYPSSVPNTEPCSRPVVCRYLDSPKEPLYPTRKPISHSSSCRAVWLWGWGDETGHAPTDISFAGVARGPPSAAPREHQPTDSKLRIKPTEEGTEPCSRPRKPPAQPRPTYVASPAVCRRIPEPVEFVPRG